MKTKKNGNTVYSLPSIFDTDKVDLWPGDIVETDDGSYRYTSDGKFVSV